MMAQATLEFMDDDAYGDDLAMDAAAIERATGFLMDELDARGDGSRGSAPARRAATATSVDGVAPNAVPSVSYRLLCPMTRIGRVIGKEGCVIKRIREDTGARVKVQTAARGADERVIIVGSADIDDNDGQGSEPSSSDGDDSRVTMAERALFRIFDTIIGEDDDAAGSSGGSNANNAATMCRLLVPRVQVGSLIGKGGLVISAIRECSGATVRVMPAMMLPTCASRGDELIQITSPARDADGQPRARDATIASVRAALCMIARHLRQHPARVLTGESARSPIEAFMMGGECEDKDEALGLTERRATPTNMSTRMNVNGVHVPGGAEIIFRLLCPVAKTGSVIGRNGEVIQSIRRDTGATVKVCERVDGADERIICVSSSDDGSAPLLAAQVALFRAYRCIVESAGSEVPAPFRLLVRATHIGCVIGKGGSIIKQIRNETGATVRVLPADALPACANDDDELLEIGQWPADACASAIRIVSGRLRGNMRHKAAERMTPGTTTTTTTTNAAEVSPNATWQQTEMMYGMTQIAYDDIEESELLPPTPQTPPNVLTMKIPNDHVGSVLGKGGCNIDIAREVSGAKIKLHKTVITHTADGKRAAPDRQLDVCGTPEQIDLARDIIERFIASSGVMLPEYDQIAAMQQPKPPRKPRNGEHANRRPRTAADAAS